MRELRITDKTGFKIRDPNVPVIIRDFRGILFYTTEPSIPNIETFNMPFLGVKYFVESGSFQPLSQPVEYELLALPKTAERELNPPFGFDIVFGNNPNKCTISFKNKIIFFDNAFKEKTLPEIYFVLFHEFAHQYFHTEDLTDTLAANYMLKKGFNPEQIGRAQITSLSSRQLPRKSNLTEKILEANAKR